MADKVRKYTNDEVTVVWKPDLCIHSTACWHGLGEVFKPKERPWIQPQNSTTDKIIEQVRKCPSGALSYYLNKEKVEANDANDQAPIAEAGHITAMVEVSANGPYLINQECVIKYADGREERKNGTIALCRCGASNNKPFCDGTHNEIEFKG